MSNKKQWFALILMVLILVACGGAAMESRSADEAGAPAEAPAFEGAVAEEAAAEPPQSTASQVDVQEQLIIRTADLSIVAEDTEESIEAIAGLAEESGGWVVQSSVFQTGEAKSGDISIRVPVERFDATLSTIQEMAVEVENLTTRGEDVTEEYVDLQARLQNLEATAQRVRNFLDEARNVEEALAVNQELSRLEGEIEALKGRIQYLEQSAAFSTINVSVTPDALSQPIEIGGWRFGGVVRDAVEALVSALQGLATIAVWIVIVLLPLALLVVVPLWLIFVVIRRLRRRRAAQSAAQSPESEA